MPTTRSSGALTAALALSVFVLALRSFSAAPDPVLVSRWWPATAVATTLLVVLPRAHLPALIGYVVVALTVTGLITDHGLWFSVVFALANAAEALVVLWFLTGLREGRPALRAWPDYRRWLTAIGAGSVVVGALSGAALWGEFGIAPWRAALWITVVHLSAQAVILPLAVAWPRHRARVTPVEVLSHLVLLAAGAAACALARPGQATAFLLLPLLVWAAARFTPRWASLELLVVALGVAALSATGTGPFSPVDADASVLDIASSAQAFLAVSGITAVAFAVAMAHLRDSLRRLREHELQLSELLDSASGTAFIATDLEGTITLFSPGAEQLLGYAASEVVGATSPIPFHEPREISARARELHVPASYAVVTTPVDQGLDQDTRDWTYLRRDGSRLTVSLSVTAVRDAAGRPLSHLSVVRDVSDRRAAEQALVFALDKEREANRRMQELDRAKSEFVSAVSHELRTPLTSIVGYTELLTDGLTGELSPTQLELIGRIDRNGDRLLSLVEDLLTLARVEGGDFRVERTTTDLREAVRRGCESHTCPAAGSGVDVRLHLPAEPVLLEGDPEHLERLVDNLVGNAVKFTDAGGRVDVRVATRGAVGTLTVTDTGIGIPLAEQDRLFQRFFRSSLATEHAIQGTGLGLAIVRSIVEAHHGEVTVASTPGEGTTFSVELPLGPTPRSGDLHPEADAEVAQDA